LFGLDEGVTPRVDGRLAHLVGAGEFGDGAASEQGHDDVGLLVRTAVFRFELGPTRRLDSTPFRCRIPDVRQASPASGIGVAEDGGDGRMQDGSATGSHRGKRTKNDSRVVAPILGVEELFMP